MDKNFSYDLRNLLEKAKDQIQANRFSYLLKASTERAIKQIEKSK